MQVPLDLANHIFELQERSGAEASAETSLSMVNQQHRGGNMRDLYWFRLPRDAPKILIRSHGSA